ncbi:iron-containing alcohol dehydrogenase [Acidaminobacter sp. JC074]|uniref:iron-containing alcohol dehydrogenase n=1 Tax=Acidaminobacter sp. JC074 TaxID=2530199 RepID=UPI001F0F6229|nr:iron-containing alcohol dehydrogenase [Acidaminobacter sp. JC074]MCH4891248.1 iron-containing alcohol dehydrogenase [Acidaminobacter sp. JC074]
MIRSPKSHILEMFTRLWPPQKPLIYSGEDSTLKIAELIVDSGYKNPLLITGKYLLRNGKLEKVINTLEQKGCKPVIYDGSIPNPTFKQVQEGLEISLSNKCDCVLAIGGGSVIDVAKVVAAASTNRVPLNKLTGLLKIRKNPLPFYAVPTTSGSGSETTIAAVISDDKTHKKNFFIDPKLIPFSVALDPLLISSLPSHITAAVGMDALTHALEAYLSTNATEETSRHAELAIKLIFDNLGKVVLNGQDIDAREKMAQASLLAGYAFTKSSLGYVHAISHQISASYNTSHGLANAILLPKVLRFNMSKCEDKYAKLELILNTNSHISSQRDLALQFVSRVESLSNSIGIPNAIEGLKAFDYSKIARAALSEASRSYAIPRKMKSKDVEKILLSVT